MAYGWPVDLHIAITQNFGSNPASYQPQGHTGMDFGTPSGSPCYAIGAGTVVWAGNARNLGWPNAYYINPDFTPHDGIDQSAGNIVLIDHGPIVSIYGHLSTINVVIGQRVEQGQIVARSGNTGFSSGPHLHFEILPDKWNVHGDYYGRVNPNNYISRIAPTAAPTAANQRRSGDFEGLQRSGPNTSSAIVRRIPPNALEEFTGWITGENVNGTDLWYVDSIGYVHSSIFTEQKTDGLKDLNPPKPVVSELSPTQRLAGDGGVKYRPEPNTSKPELDDFLPGTTLNFVGWVYGEKVGDGTNIWLKGVNGGYIWSGGVVPSGVNGLPDLNPVAPPANPNARTVGGINARQRAEPNTSSAITGSIAAGNAFPAKGYAKGEAVDGSNRIWYVNADTGSYVYSGACTEVKIGELPDLTPKAPVEAPKPLEPVVPTPAPVPSPEPVKPPSLVAELRCVTDVVPAHPNNFAVGEFPVAPESIVLHQFGTKFVHTYGSVLNQFQNPAAQSSAHFVVSEEKITQMVSIKNRAYHARTAGNVFIGIEIDPTMSPATIRSVRILIAELYEFYGYELTLKLHRNIPGNSTNCGADVKLRDFENVSWKKPEAPTPSIPETPSVKEEIIAQIETLRILAEKI